MAACPFGSAATARVLLDNGANVEHCDKVRDLKHVATHTLNDHLMLSPSLQNGRSALMWASVAGRQEIVAVLLEYKAQVNLAAKVRKTVQSTDQLLRQTTIIIKPN